MKCKKCHGELTYEMITYIGEIVAQWYCPNCDMKVFDPWRFEINKEV
jgi:hypothetical protein